MNKKLIRLVEKRMKDLERGKDTLVDADEVWKNLGIFESMPEEEDLKLDRELKSSWWKKNRPRFLAKMQ